MGCIFGGAPRGRRRSAVRGQGEHEEEGGGARERGGGGEHEEGGGARERGGEEEGEARKEEGGACER